MITVPQVHEAWPGRLAFVDRGQRETGGPQSEPQLTDIERRVYDCVGYEPIFQDAVLTASQLPPGEVLAPFTSLELKGVIKRLSGQLVVRAGPA